MNFLPLCFFVNIFNLFKFSITIPMDLCFYTLNTSDCELPPTPVFTYYKPGSRCEIELWRGCPTYNKFDNEFECSHACIGRLNPSFSADYNDIEDKGNDEQCKIPINLDDCGMEEVEVYTFDSDGGKCEAVMWKGCETENKYDDKDLCKETCKHLLKEDEHESTEQETEKEKTEGETDTGDGDDKKSSEKEANKEEDKDKKSEEVEQNNEVDDEKKDDGDGQKLKLDDDNDNDGDPEETTSVRRSRGNQTLSQSLNTTNV